MICKLWFLIINKINLVGYETIKKHIDVRAKSATEKEISKSTACLMRTYYFVNILFQSVLTHTHWVMIENSFHSPQQHASEKVFSRAVPWEQVSLFLFFPFRTRARGHGGCPEGPAPRHKSPPRSGHRHWLTAVPYFPCPSSASPTAGRPPPRICLRASRGLGSLRPRARHDPRLGGRPLGLSAAGVPTRTSRAAGAARRDQRRFPGDEFDNKHTSLIINIHITLNKKERFSVKCSFTSPYLIQQYHTRLQLHWWHALCCTRGGGTESCGSGQ